MSNKAFEALFLSCSDGLKIVHDETGVYKNLLQENAQRAGVSLPVYTTTRHGPGHLPVFKCIVRVGGLVFQGEAGKTKRQAEKNAAMAAWLALKKFMSSNLFHSVSPLSWSCLYAFISLHHTCSA